MNRNEVQLKWEHNYPFFNSRFRLEEEENPVTYYLYDYRSFNNCSRYLSETEFRILSNLDGLLTIGELETNLGVKRAELIDVIECFEQRGIVKWSETMDEKEIKINYFGIETIEWYLTEHCNLKCQHCKASAPTTERKDELDLEDALRCVDRIEEMGVRSITFTGGEPFLNNNIMKIIEYCASKGMGIQIMSNGTLITREIAAKLAEIGVSRIKISIDGPNPDVHDSIRGVKNAFNKSTNAIRMLKEFGHFVVINNVISKSTINKLDDIYKLAEDLGVDAIHMMPMAPLGSAVDNWETISAPYIDQINELYTLREKYKDHPVEIISTIPWNTLKENKDFDLRKVDICAVCRETSITPIPAILNNGLLVFCQKMPFYIQNRVPLYNSTIEEISNVIENPFIVKLTLETLTECQSCDKLDYCGGGCRASAYNVTLNLFGKDKAMCQLIDAIDEFRSQVN